MCTLPATSVQDAHLQWNVLKSLWGQTARQPALPLSKHALKLKTTMARMISEMEYDNLPMLVETVLGRFKCRFK